MSKQQNRTRISGKGHESSKGHDHDMISIHMLKLCGEPVSKSSELISRFCTECGKFPSD